MFKISDNNAHIWIYSITPTLSKIEMYQNLLCVQEQIRANKYFNETFKGNFILSRAGLRKIIAKYLPIAPENIKFYYSKYGKPSIIPSQNIENIFFNLTHSNDMAICILSNIAYVGVDLEFRKPIDNALEIANSFFCKDEYQALICAGMEELEENFYRIWTRKEAFVKALGLGLNCPFNSFSVSFLKNDIPKLLNVNWQEEHQNNWCLGNIDINNNYIGAFALKSSSPIKIKIIREEMGF